MSSGIFFLGGLWRRSTRGVFRHHGPNLKEFNRRHQIFLLPLLCSPLPFLPMEVENYPKWNETNIGDTLIFHWTIIVGGCVQNRAFMDDYPLTNVQTFFESPWIFESASVKNLKNFSCKVVGKMSKWKQPWLVVWYRGLYYPVIWGL